MKVSDIKAAMERHDNMLEAIVGCWDILEASQKNFRLLSEGAQNEIECFDAILHLLLDERRRLIALRKELSV